MIVKRSVNKEVSFPQKYCQPDYGCFRNERKEKLEQNLHNGETSGTGLLYTRSVLRSRNRDLYSSSWSQKEKQRHTTTTGRVKQIWLKICS